MKCINYSTLEHSHQWISRYSEILININKAIDSSVEMRNKKDLIAQFIEGLDINSDVDNDWEKFVNVAKLEELNKIITDEILNKETYKFVGNAFRDGEMKTIGMAITGTMPPASRFDKRSNSIQKIESYKQTS